VPSYAVDLPGHGASSLPLGDLYTDAAHVAAAVESIAARHGDVVLVGHSYAGAVVSQAMESATAVRHLVYLTAYCLDAGLAVRAATQAMPPASIELGNGAMQIHADRGVSTIVPELAVAAFYGCCPPTEAAAATARLCPQTLASFTQPVTVTPWKATPSTYVRCLRDEAIPISHQDLMAVHCGAIATIDTDHSPFLSAVVETADIIEPIARG